MDPPRTLGSVRALDSLPRGPRNLWQAGAQLQLPAHGIHMAATPKLWDPQTVTASRPAALQDHMDVCEQSHTRHIAWCVHAAISTYRHVMCERYDDAMWLRHGEEADCGCMAPRSLTEAPEGILARPGQELWCTMTAQGRR